MAIEWYRTVDDNHYEVRSAGATRRLYTNKVFHSQYNPNRALQGGIWDLLYLPAFASEQNTLQRVLVLGVGGGTVLQQIKKYFLPEEIIGIELSPVHLVVAREHFGLTDTSFKLVEDNAINWLENYSGEKFDLIIDDLYGHHDGIAERAIKVNKQWAGSLLKHLSVDGMLIINFGDNKEFKNNALLAYKMLAKKFQSIFRLTRTEYENAIGVFSYKKLDVKKMRERCQQQAGLSTTIKKQLLKYTVKNFK